MKKLEKLLERQGLSEEEAVSALKQLATPEKKREVHVHRWNPRKIDVGIIPDTHMGSSYFGPEIYFDAVRTFDRLKVDAVYHVGDIIEGMSNREGHVYELSHIGVSAQVDYACELLSKVKQPLFFIEGNHHEWAMRKGNQGVSVGQMLEERLDNATKIGDMSADVELASGVRLRLTHEGASAYALSYSGQKRINALEGGTKPNIMVNGHLHKALYMLYRNIHYFEAGSMQRQTPFMAMKGAPSMLGYWVISIAVNRGQLAEITPKFRAFY